MTNQHGAGRGRARSPVRGSRGSRRSRSPGRDNASPRELHYSSPAMFKNLRDIKAALEKGRADEESDYDEDALVSDYRAALKDLTSTSGPLIANLTIVARENLHAAAPIADAICDHANTAKNADAIAALYLMDSIVKNIGDEYVELFAKRLEEVFYEVYGHVDRQGHLRLEYLFQTWVGVFPPQLLQSIYDELNYGATRLLDPPQPDIDGIVVNPKYILDKVKLDHIPRSRSPVRGAFSPRPSPPRRSPSRSPSPSPGARRSLLRSSSPPETRGRTPPPSPSRRSPGLTIPSAAPVTQTTVPNVLPLRPPFDGRGILGPAPPGQAPRFVHPRPFQFPAQGPVSQMTQIPPRPGPPIRSQQRPAMHPRPAAQGPVSRPIPSQLPPRGSQIPPRGPIPAQQLPAMQPSIHPMIAQFLPRGFRMNPPGPRNPPPNLRIEFPTYVRSLQQFLGTELKREVINQRQIVVINEMMARAGHRCTSCGHVLRDQQEHARHMDWHFQQNIRRRTTRSVPQPVSRQWFLKKDAWISDTDPYECQPRKAVTVVPAAEEEPDPDKLFAVPADERNCCCTVCCQPFKVIFNDEMDEWVYPGACYENVPLSMCTPSLNSSSVRPSGSIVHVLCRPGEPKVEIARIILEAEREARRRAARERRDEADKRRRIEE